MDEIPPLCVIGAGLGRTYSCYFRLFIFFYNKTKYKQNSIEGSEGYP